MADSTASRPRTPNQALRTAIWLAVFVAVAFFLRSYFSVEAGWDPVAERHLETGNDPYYHWRTTDHVVREGSSIEHDPAINFPEGRVNPNPPFWTWTTAPVASLFDAMGLKDPVGTALNVMVAFWGALTVLPVYMLGRDLWNRRAGLWAAFFIAISAPHIQRSIWGYADHDAISMFSIVLGFAFLVRGLQAAQARNYVTAWRDGKAVSTGLKAAVGANRQALFWSLLAGISLSSAALAWKGYPYALAVIAVAAGLHLFLDHLRNRDTLAVFMVYLVATLVVTLLPWLLYYVNYPGFIGQTVAPSLYVLAGLAVAGLILVPTRDLPSVLVFPALLLAGAIGLVILLVVFPVAGDRVFSGIGYFSQSKLYSTIAEAQRPTLGTVAANFGFFTFLLAFWGFFHVLGRAFKGEGSKVFMASWAIVAMFMTFAASRFIVNAAPLFAILTGYAMMRIVGYLGGAEMRKRYRATHGQNVAKRATGALGWKQVLGGFGLAILLVLPVLSGIDASMSPDFEAEHELVDFTRARDPDGNELPLYENPPRFGAFGISFELARNGWNEAMHYLATLDQNEALEQRPAFIAWWDYGHWATGIGKHPTVADPFQSHYELAGRFLASDSEEEATAWLTIQLLIGDRIANGGTTSEPVRQVLQAEAPGLLAMPLDKGYDAAYDAFSGAVQNDTVYRVFERVQAAMGKEIRYLGVDDRMYPYDDPRTAEVEQASIFYAPVYLANKNPDDYVATRFGSQGQITMQRYAVDAENNSYELEEPLFRDAQGRNYTEYQGSLYLEGATPAQGGAPETGISLAQQGMEVLDRFYGTMYARAFGGISSDQPAGNGLTHWRVIHQSLQGDGDVKYRSVVLLEYTGGVSVSGTLLDDAGKPLAGQSVAFTSGGGAIHAPTVTDNEGKFTAMAPFSMDGDVGLALLANGQIVHTDNQTAFQLTREQVRAGQPVTGVEVRVTRGSVLGHVFADNDGDGAFNATKDTAIEDAVVTVAGQSTNSTRTGTYSVAGLAPGQVTVQATKAGYAPASRSGLVRAAVGTTIDIALTPTPVNVTVKFLDEDGDVVPNVRVEAKPATGNPVTLVTDGNGTATRSLAPGTYEFTVNQTTTAADGTSQTLRGATTADVPVGSRGVTVEIRRQA